DHLFSKLQAYSSGYANQQKTRSKEYEEEQLSNEVNYSERSGIRETGLVNQNDWLMGTIGRVIFGFEVTRNTLKPNTLDITGFTGNDKLDLHGIQDTSTYALVAGFLNPELKIGSWLNLEPGIRYSRYFSDGQSYSSWE